MTSPRVATLACLFSLLTHSTIVADDLVPPTEVRLIYSNGKHNAFTALARFRGALWLAFRSAKDHNSDDGDIVVLKSTDADAKTWTEAFRLNAAPDDRDPQMVATAYQLFLYDPAMTGPDLTTYVVSTTDGANWTKPELVYQPKFILWKPFVHNGKFYSSAHKKDEVSGGKGREVHFVTSADGIKWEKLSTIRAGNWESETTVYLDPKHHATAFLRQKYGSPPAQILESDPPYAEWKARPADVGHFSGHSVHTFRGVTYLLSRTMDYSKKPVGTGSMIYTFSENKLTPYCQLPAGGDCAYLEAVENGNNMLVSYYSTHEGATNIYLAVVPLKR